MSYNVLKNYIKDVKEEYRRNHLVYCPGSIYHGRHTRYPGSDSETRGLPPLISRDTMLTMEIGQLTDFLEYLFDHSQHCDHITQSEAWQEFEVWQFKQTFLSEPLNPPT